MSVYHCNVVQQPPGKQMVVVYFYCCCTYTYWYLGVYMYTCMNVLGL